MMETGYNGIKLVQHYESCRLEAYADSVGVWTIGWGNIHYEDGTPVKRGDTITQDRADKLFKYILSDVEDELNYLLAGVNLKQYQFDALVSFSYNEGIGNFRGSTLLKKIDVNPNDPTVPDEFLRWIYAGGKKVNGLAYRRRSEAYLYVSGELKFYN